MSDRILCFSLNGFTLGVEPDQIEKILVNKHPVGDAFTLETGVEVKSLKTYIPLPEKEETRAENTLFVKGQKDYYGFSVDKVQGYLKLKGGGGLSPKRGESPIKYFVRKGDILIPVLDLEYITNNKNSVSSENIEEIVNYSEAIDSGVNSEERDSVFHDVSEEDVFRSIEEEINKAKTLSYSDDVIVSEKSGILLPLLINIVLIIIFASGLTFYLKVNRQKAREQILSGSISGVEEEVIKEVRRRSEEEVKEQKKKLKDAKARLVALQEERDFFLENQDTILAQREADLAFEFEKKLEEARLRILASGTDNAELEFEREKQRLNEEFLKSREEAKLEIERVKMDYEEALLKKEEEISQEVDLYSKRISNIEQQLVEEQTKLKKAEEQFQSTISSQQEYITFRRQLNTMYNKALTYLSQKNYARGIEELTTILPIIEDARQSGVGEAGELNVEEKLVKNVLFLADSEQNRIDLNKVAVQTYEAASQLESQGNLSEALSRYFTVYTIAGENRLRKRALDRADYIIEEMFQNRTEEELSVLNSKADSIFDAAMKYKAQGEYDMALNKLEELITEYPGTDRVKESLDEIEVVNNLKTLHDEESRISKLNEKARKVMMSAAESYESGFYSEALDKYEEVVRRFQGSDYVDEALSEIVQINEFMRTIKSGTPVVMQGQEAKTGVIIQIPSKNTFLFNLGTQDGLKKGDIVGIYRREGDTLSFIGSVKVFEVYPTISKGSIMYYEREFKVGDLVSPS